MDYVQNEESIQISIIMATYNCEDTIIDAINSILHQSFTKWEFVICDDCSTDHTYRILESYQEQYPDKFFIIRNEYNSKLPYSLNRCLKMARGKYIARMDSDDISLPDRLQKQYDYLECHPEYHVVGCSMIRFDENGEYDKYEAVNNPNKYTLIKEVPFCHATIMMRKTTYDALDGYVVSKRTERGQDLDMWFRFYAKGFSGNNISEALYKVCEDRKAIKRRRIKYDIYLVQTRYIGFKLLGFPKSKYIYILKPIVSRIVPRKMKLYLRRTGRL